jgi:hypothetical protein
MLACDPPAPCALKVDGAKALCSYPATRRQDHYAEALTNRRAWW